MNMNLSVRSISVAVCMTLTLSTFAIEKPLHLSSDSRIEVVAYAPYNVVPINGTTFTTTQVIFGKNEYIEDVQNGDLGAWTASISKELPNMLFVKPTAYNSNTNMTVVTNKHTYYFHLSSNTEGQDSQAKATYAIHFLYPEAKRKAVEQEIMKREQQKNAELSAFQNPSHYNWSYSFHGDRSIAPLHVFDDGRFTYMKLQPDQPIPAVFAVNNSKGRESVVNYRQDGHYLVIDQIAPQFTLRDGRSHVLSIFNNTLIAKLKHTRSIL